MGIPQDGWFIKENPNLKWMMNRGTTGVPPIYGKPPSISSIILHWREFLTDSDGQMVPWPTTLIPCEAKEPWILAPPAGTAPGGSLEHWQRPDLGIVFLGMVMGLLPLSLDGETMENPKRTFGWKLGESYVVPCYSRKFQPEIWGDVENSWHFRATIEVQPALAPFFPVLQATDEVSQLLQHGATHKPGRPGPFPPSLIVDMRYIYVTSHRKRL